MRLQNATGFAASVSDAAQSQLIIGGGKHYVSDNNTPPSSWHWDHFSALSVIRNGNMEQFGDLPVQVSDHCMVITETGSHNNR